MRPQNCQYTSIQLSQLMRNLYLVSRAGSFSRHAVHMLSLCDWILRSLWYELGAFMLGCRFLLHKCTSLATGTSLCCTVSSLLLDRRLRTRWVQKLRIEPGTTLQEEQMLPLRCSVHPRRTFNSWSSSKLLLLDRLEDVLADVALDRVPQVRRFDVGDAFDVSDVRCRSLSKKKRNDFEKLTFS